jgi:hypothetical protein
MHIQKSNFHPQTSEKPNHNNWPKTSKITTCFEAILGEIWEQKINYEEKNDKKNYVTQFLTFNHPQITKHHYF